MAEPIETISYVARRFIQFEKKFAEATEERRKYNSQLLRRISRNLVNLEQSLYRNELALEACRELAAGAVQLSHSTSEEIGEVEAEKLTSALEAACDAEKLMLQYRHSSQHDFLSSELVKAAILTRALADGLFIEENATGEMPRVIN